ncbi:putative porin [Flavobacterium sp.]|uniref:putative porin n=1 Tax=Flavobacterium sp. TaxID=239 RepID=UPI0037981ED3
MRILLFLSLLMSPTFLFSQVNKASGFDYSSKYNSSDSIKKVKKKVATMDMYRIITLERDTTYIDTSLTIKKLYSFNYLRKDTFGLLPFSNEGGTYNTLQYSLTDFSPFPEFGFKAKQFDFLEANQIRYASVATPVTELYSKTVMAQGQSVDAFITLNISPRLNFSIAYRGLRSLGKYINQTNSNGNFRFTTSYATKNDRYSVNSHFTSQDISNAENGGITTPQDFESGNTEYTNRQRLEVYLTDAKSYLHGNRLFFDHLFRVNAEKGSNNLYVAHQFNYENKNFVYSQITVPSSVGATIYNRFGDSYKTANIYDQTLYDRMYNKLGLVYENTTLGKFQFFADDFINNYFYHQVLIRDTNIIPAKLNNRINNVGGQYEYQKNKWTGKFIYSRSLTNQNLSNLDAKMQYDLNDKTQFFFRYQNINKLPNNNYNLYQSSYVSYNWSNDFKNEKINSISANAITPWLDASIQFSTLNDHLYFTDVSTDATVQLVAPKQYSGTINYVSAKVSKEFKFGKFALDNSVLYQKTTQNALILNVPEIVTRNTFYFSDNMFHKALFFQTGITFNYFTNYYANDYNPVIGEFFVQNKKQIGNYPNFDLFFNGKIQRTRIYLIAEHFNSSLSGNNYYSAPNNPYRDFTIRFGLVWNFFE